jgi:hypothetical protein
MSQVQRAERLQLMLTPEEVEALDDWRFSRRMPTRAAAIRELLRRGLAAEGFSTAQGGNKSTEFGVIDSAPRADDVNGSGKSRVGKVG